MSIMEYRNVPHFVIKANLQKSKNTGVYFSDAVTPKVLRDVCCRIVGKDGPVSMETLAKICVALDCGLDDIVEIQKDGD